MKHSREETLAALVTRYLQHAEGVDKTLSIEELCAEHPELIDEVRRSVGIADSLESLNESRGPNNRMVGEIVADRYRVVEPIGSGAMGVVYSAEDLELGRTVALKIVHTGLMGRDTALARFEREATALASIKHPSVVTVYDRGMTDSGLPFLAMEYLDGRQCSDLLELAGSSLTGDDQLDWLKEALDTDSLSELSYVRQVLRWGASLASGLQAAHDAGVFHRDIKPSNIMICRDGRAVLLDFGIAARLDSATLTRTGTAVGTPAYMAPETLLPRRKPDARLDVYGLTATLYHLLTLRAPFEGSPIEVFSALATREPEPASQVRPGLPRDAQAILDTGMAHAPNARYATAKALQEDLEALVAFRPVSVRPTSTWTRSLRRLRRSRAVVGGLIVATLVLLFFGAQAIQQARQEARIAANQKAQSALPANLTLVGFANRRFDSEESRAAVGETLDQLVESGYQDLAARTLRAAFYLDHGNVARAVEDMEAVASRAGTDYTQALLTRYESLPSDASSAREIDLEDLPEPTPGIDEFVAGFHFMRVFRDDEADALLSSAELQDNRLAQEWRLVLDTPQLMGLMRERKMDELFSGAEKLLTDIQSLEARSGGPSAGTAHLRSLAYLMQDRFLAAFDAAEEGLELSPWSVGTMVNAANSARQLERFDQADAFCLQGLAIRHGYSKLLEARIDIALDDGQFAAARERLDESTSERGQDWLARRLVIDVNEAFSLMEGDPGGSAALCATVIERAEADLQEHPQQKNLIADARAIASGNPTALLLPNLEALRVTPLNASLLSQLPKLMRGPEGPDLSPVHQEALLNWIVELERTLSRHARVGAPDPN